MAAMNSPILSGAMVSNALFGVPSAVYASSATWNLNPTSGEWNTAANWTRAPVPDGPRDVGHVRPIEPNKCGPQRET